MTVSTMTTAPISTPPQQDTSPNFSPLLALAPAGAAVATQPPTLAQCKAFQREITDAHTNYKFLAAGAGLALGGAGTAMIGGISTVLGGILFINTKIQHHDDMAPIVLIAAGATVMVAGGGLSLSGIFIAALGAFGIKSPTSYFRAQWAYNTGGCRRTLAEAAKTEQSITAVNRNDSATRIRIELPNSDLVPMTSTTPLEYPPMPSPWKVAAAHMLRDVGESIQDAGQQLGDNIIPVALTGAAIVVGIAALETGNTAPLQRAFGY